MGSFKETRVLYCESNDQDLGKPSVRIKVSTNEVIAEGWTAEKMTSTNCGVYKVVVEAPATGINMPDGAKTVKVLDTYVSKPDVVAGQHYITKNNTVYDYKNVKFKIWRNHPRAMFIRHPVSNEVFNLQEANFGNFIVRNLQSSKELNTGNLQEAVEIVCEMLISKNGHTKVLDDFFAKATHNTAPPKKAVTPVKTVTPKPVTKTPTSVVVGVKN